MTTVYTGGPGITFSGNSQQDLYEGTAATLNTDTIQNFKVGDQIQISDLTTSTLNLGISGNKLTYGNGDYITIDNLGPGRFIVRPLQGGGVDIRLQEIAHNDINGDGISDVLWRSDTGAVQEWLGNSNGSFHYNTVLGVVPVSTSLHVLDLGDINGDGRADVLWRSDTGTISEWIAKADGTFTTTGPTYNMPTSWHVAITGDFNADGRADILWQSDSGGIQEWLGQSNGSFAYNSAVNTQLSTAWHASATADFNGDGHDDIFWTNSSNQTLTWLGQADGSFVAAAATYQMPTGWSVVGGGDFNGDGLYDVLWRNDSTGNTIEWLGKSDGSFAFNSIANGSLATSWHVAEVGDFNGDGRDDIMWRNDSGSATAWIGQADGSFVASGASYAMPTNWHVQDHLVL